MPHPASPLAYLAERAHAQQHGQERADAAKEVAIRRLMELSRTLVNARQVSQSVVPYVLREMDLSDPEEAAQAERVMTEEADRVFGEHLPAFAAALVPIYDKHFTLDEIEALSDFYASPLGQKLIEVMPLAMGDVAALTERWARELTPVFYRQGLQRLRAERIAASD